MRMADSAASRHRLRIAVRLYEAIGNEAAGKELCKLAEHYERLGYPDMAERLVRSAVASNYPEALMVLARLRYSHDGEDDPRVVNLLRQAIDLGFASACDMLAFRLECNGDKEEAEAVAQKAVELGSWEATLSVASWRDIEHPTEAERLIYDLPAEMKSGALAGFVLNREGSDDPVGAERLAFTVAADGDMEPLVQLVALVRKESRRQPHASCLIASHGDPQRSRTSSGWR
jgi:hypothetical protein